MVTPQNESDLRRQRKSIVHHVLAKHGDKEADRDLLQPGAHDVRIEIAATVDGVKLEEQVVAGKLLVNPDTTSASSSGADLNEVVADLLARVPHAVREKYLEELPDRYSQAGHSFPELTINEVKRVKDVIARMRTRSTESKRGSVSFCPAS